MNCEASIAGSISKIATGANAIKTRAPAAITIAPKAIRSASGTARVLRDDGTGQLATMWDHTIRVEPGLGGGTEYTDIVEVRAGVLTPFVWIFAEVFYRHRQRRWRALVKRGFDYGS